MRNLRHTHTRSGKSNKLLSILQSTLATEKMCCILSRAAAAKKNHCIKNAPIKLSPGYNCASSEYFMAPSTPPHPLLLSFIVYGCAGEPHGKRFCAFSCLVYTPRAHEYAMVSAPATPPAHTLWLVQQSQS